MRYRILMPVTEDSKTNFAVSPIILLLFKPNIKVISFTFLQGKFHLSLTLYGISPNWDEINAASDERLITSLAMVCPFEPREKQALLESPTLADRCRMMTALIEMAFLRGSGQPWVQH